MTENIQQPVKNAPPLNLRTWARGDAITAMRLNEPVRALQSITRGVAPPVQVTNRVNRSIAASSVSRFTIRRIKGDYLECRISESFGDVTTAQITYVAKPPLLLESDTSRIVSGGIINFTGTVDTYLTRDAVVVISGASEVTESQRVVPYYSNTDIIYAVFMPGGGTGVTRKVTDEEGVETDVAVEWLDLNIDGRKWARET